MRKVLPWAAGVLLVILVAGSFWVSRLRSGGAPLAGDVTVQGVDGPVEILVDSLGVPHVWASSQADALFAQGWLHVRDRLWQMEMFRRVSQGRLSELFGEPTVATDRLLRTLGLARAGARSVDVLDPETRELASAYARGVNAALEGWTGPRPPEMVVLGLEPEAWEAVHSYAIEKVMALDLTDYAGPLRLARAREALSDGAYRLVHPAYPSWGVTIVEGVLPGEDALPPATGARASRELPPLTGDALLRAAEPPELAFRLLDRTTAVRASNSWVVGGSRSASGRPLLANDMHLGLDQPTIWYLVGLHAPGLDVVGMSLPGTPWVVAGHTPAVAWGYTNAALDDGDFFVERLDPGDSARYLVPGGSEPFRVRTEEIRVRGRDEPETLRVRETRHGPVVTDVDPRTSDRLLAYRWVAREPSTTSRALKVMNRAGSVEALLRGLRDFTNPHQNTVFADTGGAFGYWMGGRVPLRRSGGPAILPVPGWTGEHDWEGWLAFEDHPHLLNPDRGWVVTANNRQSRDSVSLLISDGDWETPYRAQRITELVAASGAHDAGSMHRIQLHVGSAFAARYLPSAVRAFRDASLEQLAARLDAWDGLFTRESPEATLFFSWVEDLQGRLARRLYGEGEVITYPLYALERELDARAPGTDSLAALAARAAGEYADLPWGEAHGLYLDHELGRVPLVSDLLGFGRGPLPREGSPHSPNVSHHSGSAPPFRVRSGPSQRHVVDMADPNGSGGFILPGGQSGFPGSPHAWDQLERWREGSLWLLPLARERVEERTVRRVRLVPGG